MREKEALYSMIAEQQAMIDYMSMMSGIDLEDDDEEGEDDDGEE